MVLRRIFVILCLLLSFVSAQNSLFFTDSYHTNIYNGKENLFIIHNNLLPYLTDSSKNEMAVLLETFSQELAFTLQALPPKTYTQLAFTFTEFTDPIQASKIWHQKYEANFQQILTNSLKVYLQLPKPINTSVGELALQKLAFENFQNFSDRNNDFYLSRIHFVFSNLNIDKFNKENINPNLSLNRIVTNSVKHRYREAFLVNNLLENRHFYYGPNNKAKFNECIALHLFCSLNNLDEPIYFNKRTCFSTPVHLIFTPISEIVLNEYKKQLEAQFLNMMNDPSMSFYNYYDKEKLKEEIQNFTIQNYLDFVNLYVNPKKYSIAMPNDSSGNSFNQSILLDSIQFKTNSIIIKSNIDSLLLKELALFLVNNEKLSLNIVGYASSQEYTKIDQKKFIELISKYKDTPPVKVSKNVDLAIYRAVIIFDYLAQNGVSPKQLFCLSKKMNEESAQFTFVKFEPKQ